MSETPIYDEVTRALNDVRSAKFIEGQIRTLEWVITELKAIQRPSRLLAQKISEFEKRKEVVHREQI
jgi:hypothetical protein